jgi:hypothetical protein
MYILMMNQLSLHKSCRRQRLLLVPCRAPSRAKQCVVTNSFVYVCAVAAQALADNAISMSEATRKNVRLRIGDSAQVFPAPDVKYASVVQVSQYHSRSWSELCVCLMLLL